MSRHSFLDWAKSRKGLVWMDPKGRRPRFSMNPWILCGVPSVDPVSRTVHRSIQARLASSMEVICGPESLTIMQRWMRLSRHRMPRSSKKGRKCWRKASACWVGTRTPRTPLSPERVWIVKEWCVLVAGWGAWKMRGEKSPSRFQRSTSSRTPRSQSCIRRWLALLLCPERLY